MFSMPGNESAWVGTGPEFLFLRQRRQLKGDTVKKARYSTAPTYTGCCVRYIGKSALPEESEHVTDSQVTYFLLHEYI